MTLTVVGSTTLDGVQRAPSGGVCLWDYSTVYEIDPTTGAINRQSPPMPQEVGEFSPAGVGYVDRNTGEFWVLCNTPGHPRFRKLSTDFSTWTDVGTAVNEDGVFWYFGVVRVGNYLVSIVNDANISRYVVRGYALDGDTLLWSYTLPLQDSKDENGPECGTCDGSRYIYWTIEGPYVYQFDAIAHNADPVKLVDLTDAGTYWEYPNNGSTDPRLDIDINGSFPANDGFVYSWGSNEGYSHGSTNRNQVFAYRSNKTGGWVELGEGTDDPTPDVTRNYKSFSGTCTSFNGKLYLLNDHFNPYLSSFDLTTGHYTTIACTLQGVASYSPSALCGSFDKVPGVMVGKLLDTKAAYAPIRPLA